jgi:hypothetical protein
MDWTDFKKKMLKDENFSFDGEIPNEEKERE